MKLIDIKEKLDKTIDLAFFCRDETDEEGNLSLSIEDFLSSEEEIALESYLETLSDEEVHAIMSIMYLGMEGDLMDAQNSEELLELYMDAIKKSEKDIEITTMTDKIRLYDYLNNGRHLLKNM